VQEGIAFMKNTVLWGVSAIAVAALLGSAVLTAAAETKGMRAANAGPSHGPSNLMKSAPSQYGSSAASAGSPPTVGASHDVWPLAMLTM